MHQSGSLSEAVSLGAGKTKLTQIGKHILPHGPVMFKHHDLHAAPSVLVTGEPSAQIDPW